MKNTNKNIKQNNTTIAIIPVMIIGIPIITALALIFSYNSDGLSSLFTTISRFVDYSGFKEDGGWHFKLLLVLPILSLCYYVGFTMLKKHEVIFSIQILKYLFVLIFIVISSIFLMGVGWAIAVYLIKAFSFIHLYGSPFDRLSAITSSYPYVKSYNLLADYLWSNIVAFCITVALLSIVQLILSKTVYPTKIEPFFSEYMSDKANFNKKSEGLKSSKDELEELNYRLSKMKSFEPAFFFKHGRTFIAKDIENKKPIYIGDNRIVNKELPHFAIVGASGSGKGVFSQSFLVQMILKDYPVIAFDPNEDEHMMKNLKHNAEKMGKRFHWINFKNYDTPQINILQDCNAYEFKELTNLLFPALKIKNSDGNYYAQFSRRARGLYEKEVGGVKCMFDLHKKVFDKYGEDYLKDDNGNLPQFVQEFAEFASIPMFKVEESISIAEAIQNADVIYISCPEMSADDEITYLCKAFFIRILQIIKSRDLENAKHVFLFVDEFAEFVNKSVKSAIEQVRKKGCTMLMNMTSFESLDGIDTDVKGSAVITTVKNNSLKLIYQQPHEELSAKASKMTGEKIIKVERSHIKRNEAMQEIDQVMETVQTSQMTNVFSSTMLANLPAKVGVFVGQGLPRLVQTEILKYPRETQSPTLLEAPAYHEEKESDNDDSDIMGAL
ncbi:type IV secretion system DNA-binding domain-containing protein [Francisellaceae bacterium CB299]|jgi:hypothetical protein